ncbi:MAG: dihydroorotase [Betaproteobacteria bacterium]|nr:dihydroorotase [Betaproteobacteria bacterium]
MNNETNIALRQGRVIDPATGLDQVRDLFIASGVLVAMDTPPAGCTAGREIDATGLVVCPGLVDLCARLREPGFEYKATLESELRAAVAGGVTSVVCPPDTDPPLDEPGLVDMLKARARRLNLAEVLPIGALTQGLKGVRLTEMAELREAGCIAFGQANYPLDDKLVLLHALQYASTFALGVWLQPQDESLSRGGIAHDGEVATRLGLPSIPASAETVALAAILLLAREAGARVHIGRISCADSVNMIRRAKVDGLSVTCDVAATHIHLSELDIGYFDTNCYLIPPLRTLSDREALRAGLADGTIDAICSDHTPVDDDGKQIPFGEAQAGATGLELLLPLTLKWAQETGIALKDALARITVEPARVLGLDTGRLQVGLPANLCVFDPSHSEAVTPSRFISQGRNTPFAGRVLPGQVRYTVVSGRLVYEHSSA